MDVSRILDVTSIREDSDWEFKSARGGLPGSLWETYSAMANTDGGTIVLGVEDDGTISGLNNPAKMQSDFWSTINNRGKVSLNLLTDQNARIVETDGQSVLVIEVPRAGRRQRPVYINQNPLTGTYRRNYEGDYHCSQDEVGRMLADQTEEPADSFILEKFGLDDLDEASIRQYRNRFSARTPQHPWLGLDWPSLLEKLGGWRKDRNSSKEGLTIAGLLMFGKDEVIRDPAAVPQYHVDYREKLSDDPDVRWTDRLTIDGTWVGNLFQFYQRVIVKLTTDLKIPFQLQPNLFRKDDTIVHEAIRESLVNALVHSDFRGQGGVIVEKYRDRFEMSNPGTLLVSFDQLLQGGISECRNKSLQQMFLMIGGGERAGSGIDKIRQGWTSQHWRSPRIQQRAKPDRVILTLPMLSLLPGDSLERLRARFGKRFGQLSSTEVQALVTADVEGAVTNPRLQEICNDHPADISRILQGLAIQGFLLQEGQRRWSSYRLPPQKDSLHKPGTPHTVSSSSLHIGGDSSLSLEQLTEEERNQLNRIAAPAATSSRLAPEETRRIILTLCQGIFFTAYELGQLMNRNPNSLRNRFLTPLVEEGLLTRKYPADPNRPDQAYTTTASLKIEN